MFAVVANGIQTVVNTQEQLDTIISMFPYPKFQRVRTVEEGWAWIKNNGRVSYSKNIKNYGECSKSGYADIEYFIWDNNIFYNVDTSKVGFIRVDIKENMVADSRPEFIKIKISNVVLDNLLIAHHVLCVQRILNILGPNIDVNINVPDMSVYLALTQYTGSNYVIKKTRELISKRLGAVSYTVIEGLEFKRNTFDDVFDL